MRRFRQHLGRSLHEVLRTLLHRDSSQEGDHLVFHTLLVLDSQDLRAQRLHGVVHGCHLRRILMIFLDHRLTGQVRHRDDVIGIIHTILLDGIHIRIDIATATVIVRRMHVDHQRLSTHVFRMDTRRIGQPVVRMDNVILLSTCDHTRYDGVVVDLLQQVVGITTGKLHATQIIHMAVAEVRINMVTIPIILLGIHTCLRHLLLHIGGIHIFPNDRHMVDTYDL